jgi:hypothetical protein
MASNGHAMGVANGEGSSRGEAVAAQEESVVAKADVEQPAEEACADGAAGALAVEPPPPEFVVPKMSYFQTFKIFLRFGCLAVGGPVRDTRRAQGMLTAPRV